jgi:dUTP pyrophosphatase
VTRAQHPALPDDSHVDHNAPPASPSLLVVLTHPGAQLPAYKTDEAAGLDLAACLGDGEVLTLAPLERRLVPTGLRLAIPRGFEGQVRPRSGWALKDGVTVLNSPGTIDSDYRGEIAILLINLSAQPVQIRHGDRVAQLVVTPVARVSPVEVTKLDDTDRGAGGFGHTGRS